MQPEKLDVVVIGAGVSGINMAVRLQQTCPTKTYAILESKESLGGTWDTFRYPGVRSDLDMWTYSFPFKPWRKDKRFGSGRMILNYLKETAEEFGIDKHIRYQQQVISADWNSHENRWLVSVQHNNNIKEISCQFLLMCAGYFKHDHGYTPDFDNIDKYTGQVIHPQQWPDNLNYENKQIVVIGSGATAIGIVPVLAQRAKHVIMLQRSPSYIVPVIDIERDIITLKQRLPRKLFYFILKWKHILNYRKYFNTAISSPELVKSILISDVRSRLNDTIDVDRHFTPKYNPLTQRICVSPNGEFFQALNNGTVSVVTDEIASFTESGLQLKSGNTINADIIITATGIVPQPFGGIKLSIDQKIVDLNQHTSYRGMMLDGIPNLAYLHGYYANSWILRSDLVSKFIVKHIIRPLKSSVTPILNTTVNRLNHLEEFGNSSGYWQRSHSKFYKFGDKQPWRDTQSYITDLFLFKIGRLFDRTLKFK